MDFPLNHSYKSARSNKTVGLNRSILNDDTFINTPYKKEKAKLKFSRYFIKTFCLKILQRTILISHTMSAAVAFTDDPEETILH